MGRHRAVQERQRADQTLQRRQQQRIDEHAGKERPQRQLMADDEPSPDRDEADLRARPQQARGVLQQSTALAERIGVGDVRAIELRPLVGSPSRQARGQRGRQPPRRRALPGFRDLLRQMPERAGLHERHTDEKGGAQCRHRPHHRMQQGQRRHEQHQPRRIERRHHGPLGQRAREDGQRVHVPLELSRRGTEPLALLQHAPPQRVVEPQARPQQDAVARRPDAGPQRDGPGRDRREQPERLEAARGDGALKDVQRIKRQGQLEQARKAAQHEGRE